MSSPAKKFIQKRNQHLALTLERVNYIFSYIHFCHNVMVADQVKYSRQWVKDNTSDKDKFENFLKKKLVHDYLKKHKKKFPPKSAIEDILFECEPEMPYQYYDPVAQKNKEANDRIDIKVNRIGLQNIWKNIDDQDIYLAVECKILSKLADNAQYLTDIQKFCDREHQHFRLPIEGMLAFKESKNIRTSEFAGDLNKRLTTSQTITTKQFLTGSEISSFQDSYYYSRQLRNFGNKNEFSVCHLYLDYSDVMSA